MVDIITINLNNKKGLEDTIKSVINQTFFDKVNFIIIDGNSTDGSKEIIEQYKDKLFYYVSEPDNGIFNAMNKGIRASVSDYLLFLNSGDYLSQNNVLEEVFPYLDGDYDFLYGNEIMRDGYRQWVSKYPDKLDEGFFRRGALPHQSTFIKASLQKEHPYDESCKLLGDWKFLREAWKNGHTYKHIPITVSVYGLDGISTRQRNVFEQEKLAYYTL